MDLILDRDDGLIELQRNLAGAQLALAQSLPGMWVTRDGPTSG
jgi:hypothetical protein